MVRSIISIIVSLTILALSGIYEQSYLKNNFNELKFTLENTYEKAKNETITDDDVIIVQNKWRRLKRSLHIFVPHNDVKELDMWIAESVSYVKQKNYGEAIDKIEVAIELTTQIPNGYLLKIENIL